MPFVRGTTSNRWTLSKYRKWKKRLHTMTAKAIDIAMYKTLSAWLRQKAVSETVVYTFGCSGCTRSFYQELCVNKRLSKQSRHRWFKKPSRSLWRHCSGTNGYNKYLYIIQNSIPEMSHERHGFPDHRLFECLLNNSFRLTSEKYQLTLLALCEGKPPVTNGFPSQRASDAEKVSISWRLHALFIFVAKWFCENLILQPMKDHSRKTHNDYVTKLTRSAYPGNPFVTLRAHPSHPAGGTQLFCTYGVIALRKRPRRKQRKQRVADLLTSIEHCLFNSFNVLCILCDITHTPLW